ncbi:MAG: CAP domain-containing protein [Microcoleaceae cyanobacterium MO_207.B10]|nr:CAP domain-containing protein [Microcoleaceae cyanobacterium MO_207.B10]
MAQPTAQDQLMLELINRARLDPDAEANRYDANLYENNIADLNEGLSPGTISNTSKQPLAFNLDLNDAAKAHSQWMLDTDTFSHTGAGGTDSEQRMQNAGYQFTGSWGNGENIGYKGITPPVIPNLTNYVKTLHENLFIDAGISGRGHRVNIMKEKFQEIGISSLQGEFTSDGQTFNSVITTQDFAYSDAQSQFLTGVTYTDAVTTDNFYTVGEGIGGITVQAVDTNNASNIFTTETWGSGGYSLELPAGTYDVTFSDNYGNTDSSQVTISSKNIKLDLKSNQFIGGPTMSDDNLTMSPGADNIKALLGNDSVNGGDGNDTIGGGEGNDTLNGDGGNDSLTGWIGDDLINGGIGNDILQGGDGLDTLNGGENADTLKGGNDADELNGDGGDDFLRGQAGNDSLNGGEGNDTAGGGAGNDVINGEVGNDSLTGWLGNDSLTGGLGNDILQGGDGNDTLEGVAINLSNPQPGNGEIDTLIGGAGADRFILGHQWGSFVPSIGVYYDDQGNNDYALIKTFNSAEGDNIELYNQASDYTLQENVAGLPAGTAIYSNSGSELIAVVDGVTGMDLTSSEFSFV